MLGSIYFNIDPLTTPSPKGLIVPRKRTLFNYTIYTGYTQDFYSHVLGFCYQWFDKASGWSIFQERDHTNIVKEGPAVVKRELWFFYYLQGKWDMGHRDWELPKSKMRMELIFAFPRRGEGRGFGSLEIEIINQQKNGTDI